MSHKTHARLLVGGLILLVIACSQSPSENTTSGSTKAGSKIPQTNAAIDTCKDFPVPIYPSHTSLSCETGAGQPVRQTAYIESADSVEKITVYYKTQVQSGGWVVDPMQVESATRAVVSMKKGEGYATAVINPDIAGNGSRVQIHAYPHGNG